MTRCLLLKNLIRALDQSGVELRLFGFCILSDADSGVPNGSIDRVTVT